MVQLRRSSLTFFEDDDGAAAADKLMQDIMDEAALGDEEIDALLTAAGAELVELDAEEGDAEEGDVEEGDAEEGDED